MGEPAEIIGDSADRLAWLKLRQQGIGASDAPKILGLPGAYGSQASVYLDKTEEVPAEDRPTPAQIIGRELEHFAIRAAAEKYGVTDCGLDGRVYRNRERPWQLCTLDGWVGDLKAEAKTTAFGHEYEAAAADKKAPPSVWAQCQHAMDTLELDRIFLAVVFRVSGDVFYTELWRDDDFIQRILRPAEERFWEHVAQRNPHDLDVDGSEATTRALAHLYPEDAEEPPRVLSADLMAVADELESLRDEAKRVKERQGELKNIVRAAIGTAPVGVLPDGRYWNNRTVPAKQMDYTRKAYRNLTGPFGA